jgi:hypothetical protein
MHRISKPWSRPHRLHQVCPWLRWPCTHHLPCWGMVSRRHCSCNYVHGMWRWRHHDRRRDKRQCWLQ